VSRIALRLLAPVLVVAFGGSAYALDPHMDSSVVPGSCRACHRGHGASRSPMLPAPQVQVCLECHDSQSKRDRNVNAGMLGAGAKPQLLSSALSQPFVHPISEYAFSRSEPGAVTCSSCHSPHRSMSRSWTGGEDSGLLKRSPADPRKMEYELCQSCHGGSGPSTRRPDDIAGLFDLRNESYHPVEAPSRNRSPSLVAQWAGREINCTSCHGNSDSRGANGPHGSAVRGILNADYSRLDGTQESVAAYALCYGCHDRTSVLSSTVFPEHRRHVVDQRVSCATCHNPHGSYEHPGLIRIGAEAGLAGITPSLLAGVLSFESTGTSSGACYLMCHGYDHAPATYGAVTGLEPQPFSVPGESSRPGGVSPRTPPRTRGDRDR
jgi:predicted CXXCH cytochrome family protein